MSKKTLAMHREWAKNDREDAETFSLSYEVNFNGIRTFSKGDFCAWQGSYRGYTLAHYDGKKFSDHKLGLTRFEALTQLSEK